MAPLAFREPNSTDQLKLRGAMEMRSCPARSFKPRMLCLTKRICMVQFKSGSNAASFGVRQLAAAFLSFALLAVTHRRIRSLWNQSLTKCNFCNSFILTFMQNAGGRGVSPNFRPSDPSNSLCSASISFVLILLRTLLHFFACSKNSTPLFSIVSALFSKNPGGGGTPKDFQWVLVGRRARSSWPSSRFAECRIIWGDLSCV